MPPTRAPSDSHVGPAAQSQLYTNNVKHTLDSLSLKPPAPLYALQDFKALYKYCIIIIIIIKQYHLCFPGPTG